MFVPITFKAKRFAFWQFWGNFPKNIRSNEAHPQLKTLFKA